tara:strand:+ start:780 stop:2129 length:1350 start_codon:yes stop_codon:yes gene_type:complete
MQRRRFLISGASLGSAGLLPGLSAGGAWAVAGSRSANDTVNIGVIGCKGMGASNLQAMLLTPNTRCIALCDVDRSVLTQRREDVRKATGRAPQTFTDYRRLLDLNELDAVIIATPDHWHCLQMVDACSAGKHVYVEKPIANSITETNAMLVAAKYYGTVVQVGQWQRSGAHWQEAMRYVQSGQLGQIRTVKAWAYMDWLKSIPKRPNEPAPPGVDYDMWLGPAPLRPFNPNRFHFTFRWFWDYAGGLMTDWGVHLLDVVLWGMGASAPHKVMSSGGNFAYPSSAMETPDTQQAIYQFDDFTMIWEHANGIGLGPFQRSHGIAFIGNNGTLVVDRGKWEVLPEMARDGTKATPKVAPVAQQLGRKGEGGLAQHTANFIDCIRNGGKPNCDIETGSLAAINAHLGNIALLTGATLQWDASASRFTSNQRANDMLTPSYRSPWQLPPSVYPN